MPALPLASTASPRGTGQAEQRRRLVEAPLDGRQPFAEIFDGAVEQETTRRARRGRQRAALAPNQKFGVEDRLHALAPDDAMLARAADSPRYALHDGQSRGRSGQRVQGPCRGARSAGRRALLFPPVCAGCRRHVTQPGHAVRRVLAEAQIPGKAVVPGDGNAVRRTRWATASCRPRRSPTRRPSTGRGPPSPIPASRGRWCKG